MAAEVVCYCIFQRNMDDILIVISTEISHLISITLVNMLV